jgi:hypothetical protein
MILTNVLIGIKEQKRLISVSFTALVLNELVMIALEINTWHKYMVYAEIATFASYFVSIPFLGDYFGTKLKDQTDLRFILYHHIGVCMEDHRYFVG